MAKERISPEKAKYDAECQYVQSPSDMQAPGYHNDTPNDWRRGNGCKPNFDHTSTKRK